MIEVTEQLVRSVYKPRPPNAHKYDYGHLLVVGGSKQYTGSPLLVGLAAMRAGVDLVTVVAPQRAANALSSETPNLITWPLAGDTITPDHLPEIRKFMEGKTAAVFGNGAGKADPALNALRQAIKECTVPAVIDADAIRTIGAGNREVVRNKPFVFTPHAFEFTLLTGVNPVQFPFEERQGIVRNAARDLKCVVVLKGHEDIISDGREVAVNRTGIPFMTKGGTGDTLAGIIGALLARGIDPFTAAQAGCWLNGKAGERAGSMKGEGLLATDVIHELPHVLVEALEFVHD